MIAYIDVGGGMRAVYGAGVLDFCIDNGIEFPYYIGVSAGSANIISFLGEHRERTLRFYRDYSARPEYMGFRSYFKTKNFLNLDYIYTTLTNEGSEDPLDFDKAKSKKCKFYTVATNANTGEAVYFDFDNTQRNNHYELKASCCIPIVNKAFKYEENEYYDGGIVDPVPFQKAFDDGCEKVIVTLTRPLEYRKQHRLSENVINILLKKHPASARLLHTSVEKYNDDVERLIRLEKEGKALILYPDDCCGVNTLKREFDTVNALYMKGYNDAQKIIDFLK
jgi:predicted patatin/cPLA2 family phospholipase